MCGHQTRFIVTCITLEPSRSANCVLDTLFNQMLPDLTRTITAQGGRGTCHEDESLDATSDGIVYECYHVLLWLFGTWDNHVDSRDGVTVGEDMGEGFRVS